MDDMDYEEELNEELDDEYGGSGEQEFGYPMGSYRQNNFQKNNFFNSKKKSVDDSSINKNDSDQNSVLKNNISKQAAPNLKKSNNMKLGQDSHKSSKNPQMAVNKAKNTINSIHNNKNSGKKQSSENSNEGKESNVLKDGAKKAGKTAVSAAVSGVTKISKSAADKIADIVVSEKFMTSFRWQILIILAPIIIVVMIIIATSSEFDGGTGDSSASNFLAYGSSEISDEEFYNSLIAEGLVSEDACIIEETGQFDSECNVIKFYKAIKDGTNGQIDSSTKFLMIFYAISYNRDITGGIVVDDETVDFYDYLYDSDELKDLIKNSNNLKEYLNNDYINDYRSSDIELGFDLYGYVSELAGIYTQKNTNINSCSVVILNDVVYGENDIRDGIVLDLEEYVAGVVKHEIGLAGAETVKAQAIAARTYAYYVSDRCTKPISNSASGQTFVEIDSNNVTDQAIVDLVNQVAGIIVQESDGDVLLTEYDSFCFESYDNSNDIYHLSQGNIDVPASFVKSNGKNIEAIKTNSYSMKDGQTRTEGWLILNCACNASGNASYSNICTTSDGKYIDGGSGFGMSQYGAMYLEETEGLDYESILKRFYGDSILLNNLDSEFFLDEIKVRVSRATRDNKFFYDASINGGYEGECPWYANGRAMEFLSDYNVNFGGISGNGGEFCVNASMYNKLSINTDIDSIEPGSLISWDYCQSKNPNECFGHVAFIEKVNRDSTGKVTSIEVTEGGIAFYKSGSYLSNSTITDLGEARKYVRSGGSRQVLCEANGTGCQNYRVYQRSSIPNANVSSTKSFCTIPLSQLIK